MLLGNRRYFFASLLVAATIGVSACQKADSNAVTDKNHVTVDPKANKTIGDSETEFTVLGSKALAERVEKRTIYLAGSPQANAALKSIATLNLAGAVPGASAARVSDLADGVDSLTVGYPVGLLGERQVFGAVVTKVSDGKSEKLGQLKLSDLTPLHVRAVVAKGQNEQYSLALVGCARDCKEGDAEQPLIALPILGVDEGKKEVMIDLSAIGSELNLIELMDPQGSFTQLKTKSSATVALDYSYSTLVFDIESKMVPINSTGPNAPETVFQARWYLKLTSAFNPAFKQRPATPGVGFFMTERSAEPKIQRWARPSTDGTVKYYLKNIPAEWKGVFALSMDEWNEKFTEVVGKKLLSYEFIDKTDPRSKLIVAGDVRFNVLEWDLDNVAPYGGFGPSIANQETGELLSGNVLVQGPKIIEGYSKWFQAAERAEALRADGRDTEAEQLLRDVAVSLSSREEAMRSSKFEIKLGSLSFVVKSQLPGLMDPVFARDDFELLPAGYTFAKYMDGYFRDIVEHEMGHNLGLRHNFRGNLSGKLVPTATGEVSHSIMEYLGRGHRHLDKIGPYDVMAIKYGYGGVLPEKTDMFCTDEDVATVVTPGNSPECSRDDATMDPFKFFEGRLTRSIDLLTARNSVEAPVWTVEDMDKELSAAVTGLGLYSLAADDTASRWTNFFTGGDRPSTASGVHDYVAKKVRAQLCDAGLQTVISKKSTAAAAQKTSKNIDALRVRVAAILEPLDLDASCAE